VAGLIAISTDWCWEEFLAEAHPEREWALEVLAGYVIDGDDSPKILKDRRAAKEAAGKAP
jgi:hypothetical protein